MTAVLELFPEVNFNYTFEDGQTPLHHLAKGAHDEAVVRFFLDHGASKTSVDNEGLTPYDVASQNKSTDAARIRELLAIA